MSERLKPHVESRTNEAEVGRSEDLTGRLLPEMVLVGFSAYGTGLRLINNSLYLEDKGLYAKPRRKTSGMPMTDPHGVIDFNNLLDTLSNVGETYAYDEAFSGVALREGSLGHLQAGMKYSEHIHSATTRFNTLLSIGSRFQLPNYEVEDILEKARETADEIGPLHERTRALAWSAWIDQQLGKTGSVAFGAADIAFKKLVEQARIKQTDKRAGLAATDRVRDAAIAGCDMAKVADHLGKDPVFYLSMSKSLASDIQSKSEFVISFEHIIQAENDLGLNYELSLARLKERLVVEDERLDYSAIHFWLRCVRLEQSLGADWQATLEHVRELCGKIDYAVWAGESFADLAKFEVANGIDPTTSLQKAKTALKNMGKYILIEKNRAKNAIDDVEETLGMQGLMAEAETDGGMALTTEIINVASSGVAEAVAKIRKSKDADKRTKSYLDLALECAQIGLDPMDIIDLAKQEVYGSSHRLSYDHRLKMLGRCQRAIGSSLHTYGCNILAQATPEEINEALELAQRSDDAASLIGFGAFVPVYQHEAIIQTATEADQSRLGRYLNYGAVLTN